MSVYPRTTFKIRSLSMHLGLILIKFEANSYSHSQVYRYLWSPEKKMVDRTACLAVYYNLLWPNPVKVPE